MVVATGPRLAPPPPWADAIAPAFVARKRLSRAARRPGWRYSSTPWAAKQVRNYQSAARAGMGAGGPGDRCLRPTEMPSAAPLVDAPGSLCTCATRTILTSPTLTWPGVA
eukprot:SAG31_NODE_2230_length_6144_cov_3.629115_5_plen_110_part_00